MDSSIESQWTEMKQLMESLELEVVKNAHGNAAAGVRARRGLRMLKSKSSSLIKTTVELDKARKAK